MASIKLKQGSVFGISKYDRERLSHYFENSFLGEIEFQGSSGSISQEGPIVYLATCLIEVYVSISSLGIKHRDIQVPDYDRLIRVINSNNVALVKEIGDEYGNSQSLDIVLDQNEIESLFLQISDLLRLWRQDYSDEQHFVRVNWIIDAAFHRMTEEPKW